MQTFDNPGARDPMRAAKADLKSGAAIGGGGNQSQGAGTLPSKVSVPLPGTDATQPAFKGGIKQNTPGFQGGVIPGMI